jgi:hypothetical protein
MPASHFDVKPMTGRAKFIVRHSNIYKTTTIIDKAIPRLLRQVLLNNKYIYDVFEKYF